MNTYLLIAAALSVLGGMLHSILGERLIISKMTAVELPDTIGSSAFILSALRLFWHIVRVAWWGFAALLVLLASRPAGDGNQRLIMVIALTYFVSAVVPLVVSRGKHFSWGVLLVIAVVTWLGAG